MCDLSNTVICFSKIKSNQIICIFDSVLFNIKYITIWLTAMCYLGQTWDHVQIILTWILGAIWTIKNIILIWCSMCAIYFCTFHTKYFIHYTNFKNDEIFTNLKNIFCKGLQNCVKNVAKLIKTKLVDLHFSSAFQKHINIEWIKELSVVMQTLWPNLCKMSAKKWKSVKMIFSCISDFSKNIDHQD